MTVILVAPTVSGQTDNGTNFEVGTNTTPGKRRFDVLILICRTELLFRVAFATWLLSLVYQTAASQ